MQTKLAKRLLSFFLAAVMTVGVMTSLHVFADEEDTGSAGPGQETRETTDIEFHSNLAGGDAGSAYSEYAERFASVPKAEKSVFIDPSEYDAANTTADVRVFESFEGKNNVIYMPSSGITSWKVDIPEDGRYAMRITYYPIAELDGQNISTYTTIERTLYIDGRIPFSEARYFYFPKNWTYLDYQQKCRFEEKNVMRRTEMDNFCKIRIKCKRTGDLFT